MRTSFLSLIALALASAAGCDTSTTTDSGLVDVAPVLDAPLDVPAELDADLDAPPARRDAPALPDAPEDALVPSTDAGPCAYTGLDEVIVLCGEEYTFVSRVGVFPPSDECPDFYVVGSNPAHYASTEEAIAGESCDGTCRWHFAIGASRIYCGMHSGYERLDAEGCDSVYRFPEGYFPTVEAHDAAYPCP